MKMMNRLMQKRRDKKGFTLVEIIVVLVIIAILAAAIIPTMYGMIDDARGQAMVAEARTAYVAAQALESREYASTGGSLGTFDSDAIDALKALVGDSDVEDADITVTAAAGKVTKVDYTRGDTGKNYTVTIIPGQAATVVKN